jgi:hypothetical protein
MVTKSRKWLAVFGCLLVAGIGAPTAFGWAEVGDAGDQVLTAQKPAGIGAIGTITGTISSSLDVDAYRICASAVPVSSTTNGTPGTLSDTQLFEFDVFPGFGAFGLVFNDDVSGGNLRSTLPAAALVPGRQYMLAISGFDRDAANYFGDEIFPDTFPGVFPPLVPGINPYNLLRSWTGFGGSGTYTINLVGWNFC